MTKDEVLAEFRAAGALLEGHFILTSGRRSRIYLNKSLVGMYPDRVSSLAAAIVEHTAQTTGKRPDLIVSPVMGAVVFGFETARQWGLPFVFLERGAGDQGFVLRRGFTIEPGAAVVIVEDVVSTGLSARDSVAAVRAAGGQVAALACLVDRSGGRAAGLVDAPIVALATLDIPDFDPDDLPEDLAAIPAVKPGSRKEPV